MTHFRTQFLGALCALVTFSVSAADWPQWRGPKFNGSTDESGLPATWDKTTDAAWVTPLPGPAGSTPVVWGDHVFVTSPDAQKSLLLFALNRKDGSIRWQQEVAIGDRKEGKNNMASPSPVTDGKRVIVMFGTGDLKAYDFDGKELWARNISKEYGKIANMWLYGSSPLLYKGKLYVQVLQRTPATYAHAIDSKPERESFILCINPENGENIWRQVRPSDAIVESMEAYSTPYPFEGKDRTEIIIVGGDYTTGHDPETGKELWRAGGLNSKKDEWWRIITSPVGSEDMIYVAAPKREPLFAIRPGGSGDVTKTHVAWTFTEFPPDVCTPVYYQKKLFVLDGDKQTLTCLDPQTGEKKWQGHLGARETFSTSPVAADGKIYCIGERGTVVVVDATASEFKILGTVPMGEEKCMSTIVPAHGQLFIRTAENLYCIGKK